MAYTAIVETYQYSGYPETTVSLYPRYECNDPYNCPGQRGLPASVLEVRGMYTSPCGGGVYESFDIGGYRDPIYEAVVFDNFGSQCYGEPELRVDITHSDGTREVLTGYRTQ